MVVKETAPNIDTNANELSLQNRIGHILRPRPLSQRDWSDLFVPTTLNDAEGTGFPASLYRNRIIVFSHLLLSCDDQGHKSLF